MHIGRYILVLALSFSFFWALSADETGGCGGDHLRRADLHRPAFGAVIERDRRLASLGRHRHRVCGVLIMLRPGVGVFQWAALVALGSVVVYALLMITTRAFKSTESTAALMLYPQLGMTLTGIVIAPFFWVPPSPGDLGLFALAGLFGSIGVMCLTHAFRLAPAAVVSPFEYSALIWATLLGFLLWRELPDTLTVAGTGIVVASGLYIIYRETIKIGRAQPRLPSMSPDDTGQ